MAVILLYSEKAKFVLELASAAKEIDGGAEIKVLTINNNDQAADLAQAGFKVYSINNPDITPADTANMASALKQAADLVGADAILLSSDRRGKELSGRLAEAWGAGNLTDVKGIVTEAGKTAFVRNALGGATIATQSINTGRSVVAISPRSFPVWEAGGAGTVEVLEINVNPSGIKVLETRSKAGDVVDIQAASRLVVVGQGVEKQEDLAVIEMIAKALGAEVACSKPVATDKKWFSEDRVIGLSGKICKPEMALILGVSGQVQFTVGIREAQTIISINNDENAYMNKMADYVYAADLNEVLPELQKNLNK